MFRRDTELSSLHPNLQQAIVPGSRAPTRPFLRFLLAEQQANFEWFSINQELVPGLRQTNDVIDFYKDQYGGGRYPDADLQTAANIRRVRQQSPLHGGVAYMTPRTVQTLPPRERRGQLHALVDDPEFPVRVRQITPDALATLGKLPAALTVMSYRPRATDRRQWAVYSENADGSSSFRILRRQRQIGKYAKLGHDLNRLAMTPEETKLSFADMLAGMESGNR